MGAPKGNEFWKLRGDMTEAGRKLTPEQVWNGALEYIDRCVNETLIEVDFRGKDAEEIHLPKRIGMTKWGVSVHLGITSSTWDEYRKDKKYSGIISRIEDIFKAWNVEGAMAGLLNTNLTARIENIRETVNNENKEVTEFSDKTDEDLDKELDELDT